VKADIQGRGLNDVQQDIDRSLQQIQFPTSYHAEILTQYEQQQNNFQWLWILAAIAAFGILVLLQTALGGWRLAAAVFLGLIVSLSGGLFAAFAAGGINSLISLVAFSAVLGIAARSSLLLEARVRQLQSRHGTATGADLVVRAARDRLRPTLGSAVMTGLALLPLVLFGGTTGVEIILPLAVIIWGGLLTTTLFVLFVLPAVLLRFAPDRAVSRRINNSPLAGPESRDAS
jgi:Cu/Ag efflux pump CusA